MSEKNDGADIAETRRHQHTVRLGATIHPRRHHGGDLRDFYARDDQQQHNVCTGVCNNRMLDAIPSVQQPKGNPGQCIQ